MKELKHSYTSGSTWAICDECGLQYRRAQMLERWDGLLVCKKDWEPRHPQEFVRGKADRIHVKDARPDMTDMTITGLELLDELILSEDLELR